MMDDATVQSILDSLPPKPPCSRLEPYRKLIEEMRRRGWTYRDIADVLADKCQVRVVPSTVHDFVQTRARTKAKAKDAAAGRSDRRDRTDPADTAATDAAAGGNVDSRIAALKARTSVKTSHAPVFTLNEAEPLRLAGRDNSREEPESAPRSGKTIER
jgi:IS30 family transposase